MCQRQWMKVCHHTMSECGCALPPQAHASCAAHRNEGACSLFVTRTHVLTSHEEKNCQPDSVLFGTMQMTSTLQMTPTLQTTTTLHPAKWLPPSSRLQLQGSKADGENVIGCVSSCGSARGAARASRTAPCTCRAASTRPSTALGLTRTLRHVVLVGSALSALVCTWLQMVCLSHISHWPVICSVFWCVSQAGSFWSPDSTAFCYGGKAGHPPVHAYSRR